MGFWGAMSKMVQGKPVFEAPSTTMPEQQTSSVPAVDQPLHSWMNTDGTKIIPHIELQHVKSDINGDNLEVTAWVVNTSTLEIELDKIVIMNSKRELDRRLAPGQSHQMVLYQGPLAHDDSAHKANLFYKIVQNGDLFRGDYMVVYHHEVDGRYCVDYLRPEHDIRDI